LPKSTGLAPSRRLCRRRGAAQRRSAVGLVGYRKILEGDFTAIPDLLFKIDFIVSEPPHIGARLLFDCTPKAGLFGLHVDGRRISFTENVFYRLTNGKIETVWSVIDRAAIEAKL
jgi:predicted ester cyclase